MKKVVKFIKKRLVAFVAIILILAGLFYQNFLKDRQKDANTYTVKKQAIQEKVIFSGEIDAEEKATLKFQAAARLAWIGAKEGDYVKKFQTVASLDQRELEKNLDLKLNDYLKTRADFDQTQDDNKVIVNDKIKRIVEKSQFDLNKSVLDVEIKNLAIELANLYTPIEGIVIKSTIPNAGVNVSPSTDEIVVVNPATVYFSASVDQTDLPSIKEGMSGGIIFDAYPDVQVPAIVRSIAFAPKEDETGTIYEVKIDFEADNSAPQYRLGMTGDIEFVLSERPETLTIPATFIKKENGKSYVVRSEKGRKIKTEIKIGETIDNLTEVLSGLKEGDIIITNN